MMRILAVLALGFAGAAMPPPALAETLSVEPAAQAQRVVDAARAQIGRTLSYDSRYRRIAYPLGDVPLETGVCSDVVIRALRAVGLDLQRQVHEDMTANFSAYPQDWGLKRADANIDHRRVPNLATWFARHGKALAVTQRGADYRPGDIVAWRLPSGQTHIGIVSDRRSGDVPLMIHNIGAGAAEENVLFAFAITGHFRMF